MNIEQITSRETYLAFRSEWKSEYKQISEDIREGKHNISNAFRENRDASNFQRRRLHNRETATRMLEMLKEAKEVARMARSVKHAKAA